MGKLEQGNMQEANFVIGVKNDVASAWLVASNCQPPGEYPDITYQISEATRYGEDEAERVVFDLMHRWPNEKFRVEPFHGKESQAQYANDEVTGLDQIREHEVARVGLTLDEWKASVANHERKLVEEGIEHGSTLDTEICFAVGELDRDQLERTAIEVDGVDFDKWTSDDDLRARVIEAARINGGIVIFDNEGCLQRFGNKAIESPKRVDVVKTEKLRLPEALDASDESCAFLQYSGFDLVKLEVVDPATFSSQPGFKALTNDEVQRLFNIVDAAPRMFNLLKKLAGCECAASISHGVLKLEDGEEISLREVVQAVEQTFVVKADQSVCLDDNSTSDEGNSVDYTVRVEMSVTATSPEQAAQFALEDIRDLSLESITVDVQCLDTEIVTEVTVRSPEYE